MSNTEALRRALSDLLKHAERANEIMLHEAGIGVCDVTAIAGARAALAQPAASGEPVASECDSPRLCAVQGACLGQYGTKKQCAAPQPAPARVPLHITVFIDWLAARYRAAGGKAGITDVSAWAEEVMRWTEEQHGITAKEGAA